MHGFSSRSALLVNAEVDSMGGVVESGIVVGTKASPRQAAIEKAQAELRLEYDVREERRRELEFLEKGGNPLDFKFGHAASVSVQSTSFTDQHPEQLVNSEAKGSFVLTASPHGDSVESSGRLGVTVACEPNSADNFNGHNELLEGERKSVYSSKVNIPSENSSQLDGGRNAKESEDFPGFYPKKGQAYRRRNRSRTNRDGARSSSTGGHGAVSKAFTSENQVDMELDGARAVSLSAAPMNGDMPGVRGKLDVSTSKDTPDRDQHIKTGEAPVDKTAAQLDFVEGQKHRIRADAEFRPCSVLQNAENNVNTEQPNESIKMKVDEIGTPTEAVNSTMTLVAKGLESKSSCPQTSVSMEGNGNIDSNLGSNLKHVDTKGVSKEQKQAAEQSSSTRDDRMLKEKHVTNGIESVSYSKENQNSILLEQQNDGSTHEDKEDMKEDRSAHNEMASLPSVEESQSINFGAKSEKDPGKGDDSTSKIDNTCPEETRPSGNLCSGEPLVTAGPETCSENQQMLFDKEHEDRVLEEARLIEAKRKRIAELSVGLLPMEHRHKSHWDFVLEEMAWLANDFAQERLWKTTAAAQICHQATFACQSRLEEQTKRWKQRSVTRNIARAVMEFWHSAEQCLKDLDGSSDPDRCTHDKDLSSVHERQGGGRKQLRVLQGYAARFLQHNSSTALPVQAEASVTLDGEVKMDMPELSWQDQFTEENLFYTVPPGAMEAYRKSIESYLADYERTGNNKQGEVDTPMDDAATEFGSQENEYEEDEGESAYYFPGTIKASTSTKYSQKKRKKNLKFYPPRLHELGGDFGYGHSLDNRIVAPNSALLGKRPANSLNVGPIPTKRMRTASRQRVVGPFTIGATGAIPAPTRTDASSGDTNSYQGDHSTLHGGSVVPKGSEVESAMDFDKQSTFDPAEISEKPKKKKKSKHQLYDQRWQLESRMQSEQRDQLRKRLDNHPLESNGSTGLFGQHSKKLKILKQPLESDNLTPVSGSVPSPVASQMSNMSNQTKVIKFIGGRDRGRKAKALKVSAGQSISGSPWSLFEDQALVVLVHDMGPNWELVSDAINSTLQFKCIFRKPQECKERHKILMDRTSGDGADSAEDSGSSQPYPSTLPGIPKGSARQLFQRLQGPVEEDTIKSHFEKIILIGRQMHYRKKQNDNQDIKQIAPVHGSHVLALSQVIPNNVNGGVLTPLDFYDDSNQDVVSIGYQGPHTGGLQLSSSVAVPPVHPAAGSSSSLQVGPGMSGGNNNASPSAQLNGSLRDSRYGAPRAGSLPPDEQQRIQQYNQMLSGRNVQQPNFAGAGALSTMDRGVRMLPGGDGGGVMPGIKRNTQMRRPGIQGVTSSSMLNSGIIVGMPNSMNMHSGAGQGNSMFRSRDALHMVRPGQNPEHQRQMSLPDMQMQATQAASQGVPSFSGFSSALPSQSTLPSVQAYPVHHQMPQQHSHVLSSHHPHLQGSSHPSPTESQAYVQLARERQIQRQRLLQRQQQQQHQQVPVSSAVMSHIQTQPQLPISSSLQNSSQIRSQTPSNPVSVTPSTPSSPLTSVSSSQQQQKNQVPPSSGLGRSAQSSAGGIVNPVEKQRQRQTQQIQQQLQQTSRQHPLQRQPLQSQHQAKLLKGMGRGNMPMHQNLSPDPSHLNGFSASSGSQVMEKGDPTMHLMQGQGLYPGSGMNIVQSSKPLVSQPQKSYSIPASASSKQVPLRPDSSSQGPAAPATNLGVPTSVMPSVNHQQQGQPQPSLKLLNQAQTVRRAVQQNRQVNTDVEQQFVSSNSLRGATSGIPSVSVESTNVMALSSCSGDSYRKDRESLCSPSIGNTSGNEPLPSVSQGLGQRQSSGSLQWQQQQSQHKQAPPVQLREPQQQQLEQSPQRQLPPQQ